MATFGKVFLGAVFLVVALMMLWAAVGGLNPCYQNKSALEYTADEFQAFTERCGEPPKLKFGEAMVLQGMQDEHMRQFNKAMRGR